MNATRIQADPVIPSAERVSCPICGRQGTPLFRNLTDDLFGVPGTWSFRRCSDKRCGLLWLDPMPRREALPNLYKRYYTHETAHGSAGGVRALLGRWLGRAVLQVHLGYDQGLSRLASFALCGVAAVSPSGQDGFAAKAMFLRAPRADARLLEVGCGNGEALAFMRAIGWTVLGTDFDPEAVAVARARGLEVRLGGAERLTREDGLFDAIHLGHVIEHVPDPLDLLKRCKSLLRAGGELVVLTPNTAGFGMKWFGEYWRGLEPPRHLCVFNPECLRTLCAQAGLKVRTLRTSARGARYILAMSLRARNGAREGAPLSLTSLRVRAVALFLQLAERALREVRPNCGEEIVLVATPGVPLDE